LDLKNLKKEKFKMPNIDDITATNYKNSLTDHLQYVREAGHKLGVPQIQIESHDLSKWDPAEFPHYARHFHGDKGDPEGFTKAWLHHIHKNPHHWQHWMFPDKHQMEGGGIEENGAIEMPENFVLEMVSDWEASSKVYTGSWDMTEWLSENLPKIHPNLHSKTWKTLKDILTKEGYGSVIANAMTTYKPKKKVEKNEQKQRHQKRSKETTAKNKGRKKAS
jgi:hypothetical protein